MQLIFEVEKFHEKVKRLTYGFWRFFDQFETFEIKSEYDCLGERI